MANKNATVSNLGEPRSRMRGVASSTILIGLLGIASAFMAYRLIFQREGPKTGSASPSTRVATGKVDGSSSSILAAARPQSSAAKAEVTGSIDPSLRLDLLNNSRAVNYTGSKRNIFVLGAAPAKGKQTPGGKPTGPAGGTGASTTSPPPPPPPPLPPPVVIPLKFYGVAERSGTARTRALLTSGDTILIAQAGQTVAQHFKILRIGLTKLELEDVRDHSTHDIPLEAGAAPTAAPAGVQ